MREEFMRIAPRSSPLVIGATLSALQCRRNAGVQCMRPRRSRVVRCRASAIRISALSRNLTRRLGSHRHCCVCSSARAHGSAYARRRIRRCSGQPAGVTVQIHGSAQFAATEHAVRRRSRPRVTPAQAGPSCAEMRQSPAMGRYLGTATVLLVLPRSRSGRSASLAGGFGLG